MAKTFATFHVAAADLVASRYHCEHPHTRPVQHSWAIRWSDDPAYVTGTPQELYAAGCKLIALALQQGAS